MSLARTPASGRWSRLRARVRRSGSPATTASASRATGLVRVSGGKYTTYRVMARDAIDAALSGATESTNVGPAPRPSSRCIGAAARDGPPMRSRPRLAATGPPRRMPRRRSSTGTGRRPSRRARELGLLAPLAAGFPYLEAEVAWAAEHELALGLDDVLARRLRLAQELRDRGAAIAPEWQPSPPSSAGTNDVRPWRLDRSWPRRGRCSACPKPPHRQVDGPLRLSIRPGSTGRRRVTQRPFVLALDQGTSSSRAIAFDREGTRGRRGAAGVSAALPVARPRRTRPGRDLVEPAPGRARGGRAASAAPSNVEAIGTDEPARDDRGLGARDRPAGRAGDRLAEPDHRAVLRGASAPGPRAHCPRAHRAPARRLLHRAQDPAHPREGGLRAPGRARRPRVRDRGRLPGLAPHRRADARDRRLERLADAALRHQLARLGRRAAAPDRGPARRCCRRCGHRRRVWAETDPSLLRPADPDRRGLRATSRRQCSAKRASRRARPRTRTARARSCWPTSARRRSRRATACCRRCCGSWARAARPRTRWKGRCSSRGPPSSGSVTGFARCRRPTEIEELAARGRGHGRRLPRAGLHRPRSAALGSAARGLIIGLTRGTGLPEIARATLESIAYQVTDLVGAMDADRGAR